jgi:hypothetical protein
MLQSGNAPQLVHCRFVVAAASAAAHEKNLEA